MNSNINIIVYSCNRAAQLDLLLRSLKHYFKEYSEANISVVYAYTNHDYEKAYNIVRNENLDVIFLTDVKFGSLKETTKHVLKKENNLTMFLVDDIVFKDYFSLSDQEIKLVVSNEELMATSLRLWKGINYCYATNSSSPVPNFVKGNVWNWAFASGDWGYPMSIDGNIYRTSFMHEQIMNIDFANPNKLEEQLAAKPDRKKTYMSCYVNSSKLFNIPANIVQKTFPNRHGNIISVEELNNKYLNGYRIQYIDWFKYQNNTVHIELEYKWSKNVNTI